MSQALAEYEQPNAAPEESQEAGRVGEGVIKRLSDAFWSLRREREEVRASPLGLSRVSSVKAALRFPSWGGNGWGWWGSGRFTTTDEGQIDYNSEIGDVTQSSLVMAAVRWVGNTMPEAPLVVRERRAGEDGKPKLEVKEGHALAELIRNPNPFYSGMTLWKGYALSWIADGNVYLLKVRSRMGKVVELWWVPHWMMEPAWPQGGNEFITHYVYTVDGKQYPIPFEDVIHFRDGFDPLNWRKGLSPLRALLRELYGDIQASRYTARYAKNFGVPPFILSPKPDQNGVDVDAEKIKAGLMRAISGDNTGKPLVLSSAFEVKELVGRTAEVTSETNRRIPEERFASVIGIPGLVLGYGAHWGRSTFSNYEQAVEAAYEGYLMPLWRFVAAELDRQLLAEFESGKQFSVGHDLSGIRALSEDETELYKREGLAYMQGLKKRGEARTAIGEKATLEDDVYFKEPQGAGGAQSQQQQPPPAEDEERRLRLVKNVRGFTSDDWRIIGSINGGWEVGPLAKSLKVPEDHVNRVYERFLEVGGVPKSESNGRGRALA